MNKERDEKANLSESKRVRSSGSSSREALHLKRQQLLREMQSNEDAAPISVREQVARLEKRSESVSGGPDEDSWGNGKGGRKGSPWMLWMILGLIIPVVLVGLMLASRSLNRRTIDNAAGTGIDLNILSGGEVESPEDWFIDNSISTHRDGLAILEALSQKQLKSEKVQPLVRSTEQANYLVSLQESGQWPGMDLRNPRDLRWTYGSSGEIGYMVINGVRRDFHDFRAYFVQQGDEVRLDVDATSVRSEVRIEDLAGKVLDEEVIVRCWLIKKPNFDARSDQTRFSWYQILFPDEADFVWAYCETGGLLDEIFREKLNYGRMIGEIKEKLRVTIKLGNASKEFRDDEFRVVEFLADEWVLPTAR